MSSAMSMSSSFTIFALFVSIVISKSLEFSDKNFIDSSNLKNILTPVILNDDENNHILEKRQNTYDNENGIQVNGDIEGSNSTFNQIQHGIKNSHKVIKEAMLYLEETFQQNIQKLQYQITYLAREFDYIEKEIDSEKLQQSTTTCPPIPKCPSMNPISMTSPTTPVVTQTPKAPYQQITTNVSKLPGTTTSYISNEIIMYMKKNKNKSKKTKKSKRQSKF
ncbi:Hypothetical protein SRAE_X000033300 [Strongyloides ratti]|uniref:Uncharacterized protein n=1 Tax=Strongyloides ratti TaxID=34506 RepID=A0A090LMN8_STRRB|nr:Hypothetical protein SRAE_X000033300 [Strongyloides ratti]CEF71006.1 Hypothetical protein SRAE_X000033300 [Strongyloides ratti]